MFTLSLILFLFQRWQLRLQKFLTLAIELILGLRDGLPIVSSFSTFALGWGLNWYWHLRRKHKRMILIFNSPMSHNSGVGNARVSGSLTIQIHEIDWVLAESVCHTIANKLQFRRTSLNRWKTVHDRVFFPVARWREPTVISRLLILDKEWSIFEDFVLVDVHILLKVFGEVDILVFGVISWSFLEKTRVW